VCLFVFLLFLLFLLSFFLCLFLWPILSLHVYTFTHAHYNPLQARVVRSLRNSDGAVIRSAKDINDYEVYTASSTGESAGTGGKVDRLGTGLLSIDLDGADLKSLSLDDDDRIDKGHGIGGGGDGGGNNNGGGGGDGIGGGGGLPAQPGQPAVGFSGAQVVMHPAPQQPLVPRANQCRAMDCPSDGDQK
jgi:hypothetical protein